MSIKIIWYPLEESINVTDIDNAFIYDHTIGYFSHEYVCRLQLINNKWAFIPFLSMEKHRVGNASIKSYITAKEAIEEHYPSDPNAEMMAFDNDIEFINWALEKVKKYEHNLAN